MGANVPQKLFSEGIENRFVIYRIFNITAADTVQTSTEFSNVTAAYFVPTTGVVAAAAAVISSSTTCAPAGALSHDNGYLIAYGAGVQQ